MPTVENPSEQQERSYPDPMPVMDEQALFNNGFYILRKMYKNPYEAICSWGTGSGHRQWVKKVAELVVLGYVAVDSTGDGFQLTASGRLAFHNYYTSRTRLEAARSQQFFWSNYTADELAMLDIAYGSEVQPFDPSEF